MDQKPKPGHPRITMPSDEPPAADAAAEGPDPLEVAMRHYRELVHQADMLKIMDPEGSRMGPAFEEHIRWTREITGATINATMMMLERLQEIAESPEGLCIGEAHGIETDPDGPARLYLPESVAEQLVAHMIRNDEVDRRAKQMPDAPQMQPAYQRRAIPEGLLQSMRDAMDHMARSTTKTAPPVSFARATIKALEQLIEMPAVPVGTDREVKPSVDPELMKELGEAATRLVLERNKGEPEAAFAARTLDAIKQLSERQPSPVVSELEERPALDHDTLMELQLVVRHVFEAPTAEDEHPPLRAFAVLVRDAIWKLAGKDFSEDRFEIPHYEEPEPECDPSIATRESRPALSPEALEELRDAAGVVIGDNCEDLQPGITGGRVYNMNALISAIVRAIEELAGAGYHFEVQLQPRGPEGPPLTRETFNQAVDKQSSTHLPASPDDREATT